MTFLNVLSTLKVSKMFINSPLESGVKIVGGIRKGASGFDVTFVHPKSACGVLLELVQAPPEVIETWKAAGK